MEKEILLKSAVEKDNFEEILGSTIRTMPKLDIPAGLEARVLAEITRRKKFNLLAKLVVSGSMALASLAVLVISWQTFGPTILSTELFKLLSLVFTDFATVTGFWQEYLISVLEATPFVSIAIIAAVFWLVCASLWEVAKFSLLLSKHKINHI